MSNDFKVDNFPFKARIRALSKDKLTDGTVVEGLTEAVVEFMGIPKGLGDALGNAIRRALLMRTPGYAPQAYWMANMQKFAPIPNVIESTIDIDERITALKLKVTGAHGYPLPSEFYLGFNGKVKGGLLAKDLVVFEDLVGKSTTGVYNHQWFVSILNPDQVILTCGTQEEVNINLKIKCGLGMYFSSSQDRVKIEFNDIDLGDIVDQFVTVTSMYNPVEHAQYFIEEDDSKFTENLVFDIKTTRAITPSVAFSMACHTLNYYLTGMPGAYGNLTQEDYDDPDAILRGQLSGNMNPTTVDSFNHRRQEAIEDTSDITKNKINPIECLHLDSLTHNMLKNSQINTVQALQVAIEEGTLDDTIKRYTSNHMLYTGTQKVALDTTQLLMRLQEFGITCQRK